MYWKKEAQDGATRQEAKRKTDEEINESDERGQVNSWFERVRFRGQGEREDGDLLW